MDFIFERVHLVTRCEEHSPDGTGICEQWLTHCDMVLLQEKVILTLERPFVMQEIKMIAGIPIPDSAMARAATQLIRDTEDDLLYNHSRRVFFWAALAGQRRGVSYDPELLYIAAMFHDMGLTPGHASADLRFEVDGANAARSFLASYHLSARDVEDVWTAIALHTTPGIPEHMRPTVALLTNGVEMDVLGIAYRDFKRADRDEVCAHHPREHNFKEGIIDHFSQGLIKKPLTAFGNVKADVLALKDPDFKRMNFCSIILGSDWAS
jgi:HD domain